MSKVSLIVKREYISRVRKKSFVIMTILGPLLFAALMVLPTYLATKSDEKNLVNVVDETGIYSKAIKGNSTVQFRNLNMGIEEARVAFKTDSADALLYIPKTESSQKAKAVLFYQDNQPSLNVQERVRSEMDEILEHVLIRTELGIDPQKLKGLNPDVELTTRNIETGKKSLALLTSGLGLFAGILIYFFIFIFGSQVMRGVLEEKTSRIVEVIVSSVKPFQLMMGKIIGVALVGLTQFLLWVLLTFMIITAVNIMNPGLLDASGDKQKVISDSGALMPDNSESAQQKDTFDAESGFAAIATGLQSINIPLMLLSFLFFFLFGYLLYGALFAAIGSAVDNEADTQQFMLPVTIPLLLSIVMASFIVQSPSGPVAFWFSMIPFTSPVVMMIRIPFGVEVWELVVSMGLLVITFLGAVWLAAKIYKTGILMYGSKVNYKVLWKWIRQ
ncbi:MAG: ABC transporter permease [Bacteroidales bacterium]|nr:ABC transporter permease [Bacteroidales bacterium]